MIKRWNNQPTFNTLDFHLENTVALLKKCARNISNIYVSIFDNSLQFWFMIYRWKIQPTLYIRFFTILLNNVMMKIADIYVIIHGYLLHLNDIHRWRINSQYYMLDHLFSRNFNITIKIYRLPVFRSEDGVSLTSRLNWVKVEEIANIKFYLYTQKYLLPN